MWFVRSSTRLTPPDWTTPVGIFGFPPDTWSLSAFMVGYRIDAQYHGTVLADDNGLPVIAGIPAWSVLSHTDYPSGAEQTRFVRVIEQVTGWPMPSMYGRVRYRMSEMPDPTWGTIQWVSPRYDWSLPIPHLFDLSDGTSVPSVEGSLVPLRPLLPGTAGSTLFFGSVLYIAVWMIARRVWRILTNAKKHERHARGECIKCGYALGTSTRCPECGSRRLTARSADKKLCE